MTVDLQRPKPAEKTETYPPESKRLTLTFPYTAWDRRELNAGDIDVFDAAESHYLLSTGRARAAS